MVFLPDTAERSRDAAGRRCNGVGPRVRSDCRIGIVCQFGRNQPYYYIIIYYIYMWMWDDMGHSNWETLVDMRRSSYMGGHLASRDQIYNDKILNGPGSGEELPAPI